MADIYLYSSVPLPLCQKSFRHKQQLKLFIFYGVMTTCNGAWFIDTVLEKSTQANLTVYITPPKLVLKCSYVCQWVG